MIKNKRGFSLVEILVAVTIGGLALSGATTSFLFLSKSTVGLGNYTDMNSQSRNTLERFAQDVRMGVDVLDLTSSSFEFEIPTATDIEIIRYEYNASAGTFTRISEINEFILLRDIESLELKYFNLLGNETNQILEAKTVQLDAVMKREVYSIDNTNQVISARFTMRNKSVTN